MTENDSEPAPAPIPPEKGNRLQLLFKILFFAAAMLIVMFTILGNMGGNGPTHKETVEKFVTGLTGRKAVVKTLRTLTFFPTVRVDFEDLDLFLQPEDDFAAAHVDAAQAAFSFWDVFWKNGRARSFNIQGIDVQPGVFLRRRMTFRHIAVVDAADGGAALEGSGAIGDQKVDFSIGMQVIGEGRGRKYAFPTTRPFQMTIGDVAVTATLVNAGNPFIAFRDLKISLKGVEVLSGEIELSRRRANELTLTGKIIMPEHGTTLTPDLIYDFAAAKFSGSFTSENFSADDFDTNSRFETLVNRLVAVLGDADKDKTVIDDFMAGQAVALDVKGKKTYQGPLAFKNNTLVLK